MIGCLFACILAVAAPYSPKNYDHLLSMPGFEERFVKMHIALYQGYVRNTNELLGKLEGLSASGGAKGGSAEFGALKRRLGWEMDGMRLHELYFDQLGGSGEADPKSPLYAALAGQFGSFEKWKSEFVATGLIRGIGWSVLYLDPDTGRLFNTWINEHDVGHLAGGKPLLIMDVFEHAFMPQFGLDRSAYIDAFFRNIHWKVIERRFAKKDEP
jgi:Fe-Mn family superoxide dismutase